MKNKKVHNQYTEKIIFWIESQSYSKDHWLDAAKSILEESDGHVEEATPRLGFAIRNFHLKFQDAVVKPGNVLYDFVDMAYIQVDWDQVAAVCYEWLKENPKDL